VSDYTPEQLAALKAAAAKGVTNVSNAVGESISYRSLAEMHQQIAVMERALASTATVRQSYPMFTKDPRS